MNNPKIIDIKTPKDTEIKIHIPYSLFSFSFAQELARHWMESWGLFDLGVSCEVTEVEAPDEAA